MAASIAEVAMPMHIGLVLKKSDHSMQGFVNKFGNKLPLIATVTSGYLGSDDTFHTFSSDEVYLICGIKVQSRVLVKTQRKRNLSIPLNYPVKFQTVHSSGQSADKPIAVGNPASLATLMGRLTAMGHGDEIMVHNDANVRFYKGSDSTSSGSLGRLVITDQYKEKYLIAYSLIRGKRYGYFRRRDIPIPIPVYMSIRLCVAAGLTWDGSLEKMIQEITPKNINFQDMPINEDIMLLPDSIGKGAYEYIVPSAKLTKRGDERPHRRPGVERKQPEIPFNANMGRKQPEIPCNTSEAPPPLPKRGHHDYSNTPSQMMPKSLTTDKPAAIYPPPAKPTIEISASANQGDLKKSERVAMQFSLPPPSGDIPIEDYLAGDHYESLRDVPSDLTNLSVQNVTCCLEHLQLNSHIHEFRMHAIDGQLLVALDMDMLVDDFGFTKFQAMKLMKFINGWRSA